MKFYIYTLGCKVNEYESRVMADLLTNQGFIESENDENVDVCIINTCSVTNTADHKSAKVIRSAIRKNPAAIVVVTGCFAQASQDNALQIEGVDIVIGNKNKTKIVDYINEFYQKKEQLALVEDMTHISFEPMRLNNFNKTRAFVKIQDGCNNFCSYCIIPYTRGNVRSKKKEDVIEEVKHLTKQGHKEIVLTGIHTGNYGAEFTNYDFADLLKDLLQIKELHHLRISSIEMNEINDRVLKRMEENQVLVDHMHIPLQSGSNKILKAMNRKYDKTEFINKIKQIRDIRPNISITTDIIVGFPGETEEDFLEMIATIQEIGFTKLHVFPFSRRKNTVADTMENQIEDNLKKERVRILLELSKTLELAYMKEQLHKEMIFIPEIYKDGFLIGHTGNYLLIKCKGPCAYLHTERKVHLKELAYPYIIGEIIF